MKGENKNKGLLILVDANALIHRMYHALPPLTDAAGEPAGALYGLANVLLKILEERKPDYILACFDRPEETFRHQMDETYKATRVETDEDLVPQIIKARELFRAFNIKTFELPGYEADDLIGTAVEKFKGRAGKVVVLTGDLDETQLVSDAEEVTVETFGKGVSQMKVYDEAAVRERFGVGPEAIPDYKGLVGDASDNIKGVRGVGPKTAVGFLQEFGTIEEIYKNLDVEDRRFKKLVGQERQAMESKKLAIINRQAPIEFGKLNELEVAADKERLGKFFEKLGFGSLVKRMRNEKLGEFAGANLEIINPKKKLKGEMMVVRRGENLSEEDKRSRKVKVGFELKEEIKKGLAGPYGDLGVGFWLLDPDARDYSPEYVSKRFLKREYGGTKDEIAEAYGWLMEELEEQGLKNVFQNIEMPLLPVLARMEERGIKVDASKLESLRVKVKSEISKLEKKIYGAAGRAFNINSPKQMGKVLFEELKIDTKKVRKTMGGAISTSYENLTRIKGEHTVVSLILEYREAFKILSTYIEPILEMVEGDADSGGRSLGRLRTTYLQTGTGTGRLSSEQPNLQNIPYGGEAAVELRGAFRPDKGNVFLSFDYSQVELRILAAVAHDGKMIEAFREGRDIHAETAAGIFNVEPKAVTPEMRRVAKVLNFGVIYGMGARAFAETAGVTVAEAKEKIEKYFTEFDAVRRWQEYIKREARTLGYAQTMTGRRRIIPEIQSNSPRFAAQGERVAMNMPIQGLEADIIKLAMIAVDKEVEGRGWGEKVKMLLTIHDDLLFEVKKEMEAEAVKMIRKKMEEAFKLAVPLRVEVKRGESWGEMKSL